MSQMTATSRGSHRSSGQQRDVVENILNRLSANDRQNIDDRIPVTVREKLRVLASKVKLGQLGKQDSPESRAVVLLEYVLRQSQKKSPKLSMKTLASVAFMKDAAFQTLHMKIGNYLDEQQQHSVPSARRPTRGMAAGTSLSRGQQRGHGKLASTRRARDTLSTTVTRPPVKRTLRSQAVWTSTIPTLAIRLGSLVHDSHGFSLQAEQLLQQLTRSMNGLSSYKKNDYLRDMERNRAAYEAVCFFVVASRSSGHVSSRSRSTLIQDSLLDNDLNGGEDRQLEEQHVVDAANVSRPLFRQILSFVEKLLKEEGNSVDNRTSKSTKPNANTATSKDKPPQVKKAVFRGAGSPGTKSCVDDLAREMPTDAGTEDAFAAEKDGTLVEDTDSRLEPVYSSAFLAWKEKTLREACDRMYRKRKSSSAGADIISEAEALTRAAERIVRGRTRSIRIID